VLAASYRDKYGTLGNVGVLAGTREQDALCVQHWVLSCRAFSRQLEHHMLSAASELAPDLPVRVNYAQTARNAPIQRFLAAIGVDLNGTGPFELSPDALRRALDAELPHAVRSSTGSPEQAASLRNHE
jgi:predicted enzyme involved in methoxymalonyl-ACP biosynthesis